MASAVVRIKRRITDEPFDKFVLNCKRAKTSNDIVNDENSELPNHQTDATRTILKLAATVSADDDDITTHLTKLRKPEAIELARKVRKPTSAITKLRQQLKDEAKEQRFKVINCFRSIGEDDTANQSSKTGNITVVDVIKEDAQTTENMITNEVTPSIESSSNSSNKFVYDLYLVDSGEQPTEIDINDYISIRPFDDLVYQGMDETLKDSDDNNSEDSNDEANWRNEYPDTDDDFSIGEEDMRKAVEELNVGSDADNSSSDDDDAYGAEPAIHFMPESDDEYEYFKKHGRIKSHAQYYRTHPRKKVIRTASDSDESNEENDSDSNNSSRSNVSPLVSCDEDN